MTESLDPPRGDRPRVLHVLGSLVLGGIETWLVHMLRHAKSFSVEHELLLTKADIGPYEEDVRELGVRVYRLPLSEGKAGWFGRFRKFLWDEGPFFAVHSHATPHFAAPVLAVARRAGVPARIAHSHSARSQGEDYALRYRVARRIAMLWLDQVATRKIGITEAAIEEIAGANWRDNPLASVLIYGFDFERYRDAGDRAKLLRQNLEIEEDAPVVGHVGRFDRVKNHRFLLDAFAAAVERVPTAQLVLVGQGPLCDSIRDKARSQSLAERVHFAGTTDDVPAYMSMFELFALPSFSEGLGIVAVEAQAAGTPAILSDTTPAEASVIPGAVEFLPLSDGPQPWGEAIARRLLLPKPDASEWLLQVERSKFGIRRCIDELDAIYRSELRRSKVER